MEVAELKMCRFLLGVTRGKRLEISISEGQLGMSALETTLERQC